MKDLNRRVVDRNSKLENRRSDRSPNFDFRISIFSLLQGKRRSARREEGAELVEYALVLPLLLVLLVGLLDFAMAYNIKQKLSNAAREGARLGASLPTDDLTQTNPGSIQTIHDAVVSYLTDAGVDTSFVGATMTNAGNHTWTYYSNGNYGLQIVDPYYVTMPDGVQKGAAQITLTYPYNWTFGFNRIITLLIPSAGVAGTVPIPASAIIGWIN